MELTPTERAKSKGWRVDLPDDAYDVADCLCVALHTVCPCPCHDEKDEDETVSD